MTYGEIKQLETNSLVLQNSLHTFAKTDTRRVSGINNRRGTDVAFWARQKLTGIAVSVVNSYAAASETVFVILDRNVDFPTEGKPMSAIRASV